MGLVLIIIGLLVWLLTAYDVVGLILVILGFVLLFVPWHGAYGYSYYRGRGAPPP